MRNGKRETDLQTDRYRVEFEVGSARTHFRSEVGEAEEEQVYTIKGKESQREEELETQILQQRATEVSRVKDSRTLTGVQLSVIPEEAPVPILS